MPTHQVAAEEPSPATSAMRGEREALVHSSAKVPLRDAAVGHAGGGAAASGISTTRSCAAALHG